MHYVDVAVYALIVWWLLFVSCAYGRCDGPRNIVVTIHKSLLITKTLPALTLVSHL